MAIPVAEIAAAFNIPQDDVGVELLIDHRGRPATLDEMSAGFRRLEVCQRIVSAVAALAVSGLSADALSERAQSMARVLASMAGEVDQQRIASALRRMGSEGLGADGPSEFRLDFVGGYLENPTVARFIAKGSMNAILVSILIFGGVQLMKEYGAATCRAQHADIAKRQLDMLETLARQQGRWTPDLRTSHRAVIVALTAATKTCGSMLDQLALRVQTRIGDDYEIRIAGGDRPMTP